MRLVLIKCFQYYDWLLIWYWELIYQVGFISRVTWDCLNGSISLFIVWLFYEKSCLYETSYKTLTMCCSYKKGLCLTNWFDKRVTFAKAGRVENVVFTKMGVIFIKSKVTQTILLLTMCFFKQIFINVVFIKKGL